MTQNRTRAKGKGPIIPAEDVAPPSPPDPLAALRDPDEDQRGAGLPDLNGSPEQAPEPDAAAEALARKFHDNYESFAYEFGYETRAESAVPWDDVPEANRRLMIATAGAVLADAPSQVPGARHLITPEDQDEAVRQAVAALHADTTCLGFLHKGSVCGCAYISRTIVLAVLPASLVTDPDDPEADPTGV